MQRCEFGKETRHIPLHLDIIFWDSAKSISAVSLARRSQTFRSFDNNISAKFLKNSIHLNKDLHGLDFFERKKKEKRKKYRKTVPLSSRIMKLRFQTGMCRALKLVFQTFNFTKASGI